MLVLSRKKDQNLFFPNLGISVEILRVDGKTVRIGVDAPKDIRVLRGELVDHQERAKTPQSTPPSDGPPALTEAERKARHDVRNRLHTASLALHLLQKQLDAGRMDDAEKTLIQAVDALAELDRLAGGAPADGKSTPAGKTSFRALVVEDNANERQLLAGFLEMYGYQVDVVEDGVAAMEYLATHERPDVVLLDMQMPRMDGPSTVAAIRSNPKFEGITVFAVSGEDEKEVAMPASNRGIDHWFSKPLRPAEFANNLAEELKRASFLN